MRGTAEAEHREAPVGVPIHEERAADALVRVRARARVAHLQAGHVVEQTLTAEPKEQSQYSIQYCTQLLYKYSIHNNGQS